MKTRVFLPIVLAVLVCVCAAEKCMGSQQWESSIPVTIKSSTQSEVAIVLIGGRLYCGPNPLNLHFDNAKIEPVRDKGMWPMLEKDTEGPGRLLDKPPEEKEFLHINGKKPIAWKIADRRFLSVDDKGRIVAIAKPKGKEKLKIAWFVELVQSYGSDKKTHREISFLWPNTPENKNYLGIDKKPLILKDKAGQEYKYYPLVLTESKNKAQVVIEQIMVNDDNSDDGAG